jgi:hypothetical protein
MNHEVNEMKAFLVDWLIKFGHDYVRWVDIRRELLLPIGEGGHLYGTWSFSIDGKFIVERIKDTGAEYKLSKKGLNYLNKGENDGINK